MVFFFTILGIPLAMYSNNKKFDLINLLIFNDIKILFWVGMLISSFFYTIISYQFMLNESAIFNAMCSAFGSSLQAILFIFSFMGIYQSIPDLYAIISIVIVLLSSTIYIILSIDFKFNIRPRAGRNGTTVAA